jgi:hypothetical protein
MRVKTGLCTVPQHFFQGGFFRQGRTFLNALHLSSVSELCGFDFEV